jgi:transglutaminase-like putative cysteine protease
MPDAQAERSRWVLWMPKETVVNESLHGDGITREVREVGKLSRVEWRAFKQAPVLAEPSMPGFREVANHLVLSTLPTWEMFFKWEEALLVDAFRASPEVEALAKQLGSESVDAETKIRRIHEYLMREIRYQQDYERYIAGVKPHVVLVVLARQYGDCKDKAVLFITLARLMGLKVQFALVRTRDSGPVERGVPMQQFNHAIVYVPKQPGLEIGRFYDPTVDALDIDVLRQDDQGTLSILYDPETKTHAWKKIPY